MQCFGGNDCYHLPIHHMQAVVRFYNKLAATKGRVHHLSAQGDPSCGRPGRTFNELLTRIGEARDEGNHLQNILAP